MARSERKRLAFGGLIAIAVPIFVACNGIIGLSDFEKVECGGRRCADSGTPVNEGGADVVVSDAPAEARGADPVSWAQWHMPNYDGGAEFLPNPLKFDVVAGDNLKNTPDTNLVWRRSTLSGQKTFDDAKRACADLPDSGPWRLPKRIELVTLLDFGRAPPLIDPQFTGVRNVRVWTSSELRPFTGTPAAYWTVDFGTGIVATLPASPNDVADVLCVKGK
jgi:Protein of unknown function (DUF1566)